METEGEGGAEEEEEEEEDEEQFEDDVLDDIHPHMLLIERTRTDDTFTGRLSKYVFQRAPFQEHISLTHHQELAIYIRFHVLPLLREVLHDSTDRWYFWLAACISYYKENQVEETCERWSSFRSESNPLSDCNI